MVDAICEGSGLEQINTYVSDISDEVPGWQTVFNPQAAPDEVLPYLAQFAGVRLDGLATIAERREQIQSTDGFRRGTRRALEAAVQRTLTGSKMVTISERDGGPWRLRVQTLTSEMPNPELTRLAVLSQKPIGLVLVTATGATVDPGDPPPTSDDPTWAEVDTAYATWSALDADYATWEELRTTPLP